MRENSRRGAPRSARPADRSAASRDSHGRGGSGRPAPGRSGTGATGRGPGSGAGRGPVSRTNTATEVARLTSLLEPILTALELDLEAVRLSTAGRRRLLRIVVDGDGGVSLDDIADVSREIAARLDAKDAMGDEPYTLEVSSPGVDRPLTKPAHWRRASGRLVNVEVTADPAGHADRADAATGADGDLAGQVRVRVLTADADGVIVELDGADRRFSYAQLGPGRIQVEFARLDDGDDEDLDLVDDQAAEEEPDGY